MSYYPDGTGPGDKSAPWNWQEPKFIKCENCSGAGTFEESGELYDCDDCKKTGYIEEDEND